jgi:hypothetical protein
MAAPCFVAYNSASGSSSTSTAAPAALTFQPTGTSARSMLQIKTGTPKIRIIEWGYSFDVVPTALVKVSLVNVGASFSTLSTALAAGDIMQFNDSSGPATQVVTGSTSGSAFATAAGTETSISANTMHLLAFQGEWGQQFKQQFPLGREPEIGGGAAVRIVVTTATTINMSCYIVWEE